MRRFSIFKILILVNIIFISISVDAKMVEYALPSEAVYKKYERKAKSWYSDLKKKAEKKWTSYFGDNKKEKKNQATKADMPKNNLATSNGSQNNLNQNESEEELLKKQQMASKVEELQQQLPEAKQIQEKNTLSNIITGASAVATQNATVKATPGRKGTSKLPLTKTKVPYFSLKKKKVTKSKSGKSKVTWEKVKEIPRLDIGEEPQISKSDFTMEDKALGVHLLKPAQPLPNVKMFSKKEIQKVTRRKVENIKEIPSFKNGEFGLGKVVTHKKIDRVNMVINPDNQFSEKDYVVFTNSKLKILKALILNNKGDKCHAVAGLFYEALKEKDYKDEANFNLAICSHNMGFYSEATLRLVDVIKKENPEYASQAIDHVLKNLPVQYEKLVAETLLNLRNKELINKEIQDRAYFYLAKGLHKKRDFKNALKYSAKISDKSEFYAKALYITGISNYALNQLKSAESSLVQARNWLAKKNVNDKELSSLISINLARMKFRQNRFKEAHADYMKIHKDTSLWVQGLIEQGWTQLQISDPEGAIGNMYSLHSPYFKTVYKPESYVVRSIGYINICQYGDAYRTLTSLEKKHRPWISQIDSYIGKNKKSYVKYYNTVKGYLQGNSSQGRDGLPYQVIREMGRRRGFLAHQESLNLKEDERSQFNFIHQFILKDKAKVRTKLRHARNRLTKLDQNLRKAKKDKSLDKFVNEWKANRKNEKYLINYYKFELSTLEEGRKGFKKMQTQAFKRMAKEKANIKWRAGSTLRSYLVAMNTEMKQFMENNEFLRYEVFSGSGENIRYQVAGGEVADAKRIPANVKPKKIMNWDFEGEFWEDEIGSYRSSLTNNCPKLHQANGSSTGFDPTKQVGM